MPEIDSIETNPMHCEDEKSIATLQPFFAMTALAMNGDRDCSMAVEMDCALSRPIPTNAPDEALEIILRPKEERSIHSDSTIPDGSVEVDQLLDRIDDDRVLLTEIVGIFRREYPHNLQAAQRALDAQRPADLERVAHTLKGVLGNLSATGASALAAELETLGQSADLTEAQTILDALVLELGKVMRALEALCPEVAQ